MDSLPGEICGAPRTVRFVDPLIYDVPATMICVLRVPLPAVSAERPVKTAPVPVEVVAELLLKFPPPV